MLFRFALLLSVAVPCFGQATTGGAATNAECSAAVTGSNDQITLKCPGASREELEKISKALNKLLSKQPDMAAVNKKLDEILGAITAIKPADRRLSSAQEEAFADALRQVKHGALGVVAASSSDEATRLVEQITALAESSGWDIKNTGDNLGGKSSIQADGLLCYSGGRGWSNSGARAFIAAVHAANMSCDERDEAFTRPVGHGTVTLSGPVLVVGRNALSHDGTKEKIKATAP